MPTNTTSRRRFHARLEIHGVAKETKMGRLITGIVLLLLVLFAFIGIMTDPAGALSGEGSLEGIVFVCLMLVGGALLVYSGANFIARRRRTINYARQMLRHSDGVDAGRIAELLRVSEIQVVKFLKYGQKKGVLSDLDGLGI